jgi:hypothetical protein
LSEPDAPGTPLRRSASRRQSGAVCQCALSALAAHEQPAQQHRVEIAGEVDRNADPFWPGGRPWISEYFVHALRGHLKPSETEKAAISELDAFDGQAIMSHSSHAEGAVKSPRRQSSLHDSPTKSPGPPRQHQSSDYRLTDLGDSGVAARIEFRPEGHAKVTFTISREFVETARALDWTTGELVAEAIGMAIPPAKAHPVVPG